MLQCTLSDRAESAATSSGDQHTLVLANANQDNVRLTPGEARVWARRFRKLGFSPVTTYQVQNGYPLLCCNFPYELADLPEDLIQFLFDPYEDHDPVWWIATRIGARHAYVRFQIVKQGMGSKVFRVPKGSQDSIGFEASMIPSSRLVRDSDSRSVTRRHPDIANVLRDIQANNHNPPESSKPEEMLQEYHVQLPPQKSFACPCCDYYTLPEPPPGTFYICPVCGWEDDAAQYAIPDYPGGANRITRQTARRNFASWGYAKEHSKHSVRPPRPEEFSPEEL